MKTESLSILLRREQGLFYKDEVSTLKTKSQVDKTSRILKLYPFLHENVFCVGGRLVHANLPDKAKYQRIVPPDKRLARLIIANAHEKPCMVVPSKSWHKSEQTYGSQPVVEKSENLFSVM